MAKRAKVPPTPKANDHPALTAAGMYVTTSGLLVPAESVPGMVVITPWYDHGHLHGDYWAAMSHLLPQDRVIVVDDGSLQPVAEHARGFPCPASRCAVRLSKRMGFAPACNAGFLAAAPTADSVVVFLNNDVRLAPGYQAPWWRWLRDAYTGDYRGLAGPEVHDDPEHARVDTGPEPYISGWCIAGRADTFRRLAAILPDYGDVETAPPGPWDASYQEPSYYGDNDLCARARYSDVPLLSVECGLEHLRNITAGPQSHPDVMDASIRNRARWAETVARLRAERGIGKAS